MPTFDREIARLAERLLIKSRPIDYRLGVFASEVIPGIQGEKPVTIKMIDADTKEHVETIEVSYTRYCCSAELTSMKYYWIRYDRYCG